MPDVGTGRISSVLPSAARRCTTRLRQRQRRTEQKGTRVEQAFQACVEACKTVRALARGQATTLLKTAPRPCINLTTDHVPDALPPSGPAAQPPAAQPLSPLDLLPGRSSRSNPLHQPPSLPKPSSDGSSSRHRSSRPPTPTPPPPGPQPAAQAVDRISPPHPSPTPA